MNRLSIFHPFHFLLLAALVTIGLLVLIVSPETSHAAPVDVISNGTLESNDTGWTFGDGGGGTISRSNARNAGADGTTWKVYAVSGNRRSNVTHTAELDFTVEEGPVNSALMDHWYSKTSQGGRNSNDIEI